MAAQFVTKENLKLFLQIDRLFNKLLTELLEEGVEGLSENAADISCKIEKLKKSFFKKKSKINSKKKGSVQELAFVNFLKASGFNARRTAQYCGKSGDASDVVSDDIRLADCHFEVKAVESLNIHEALAQAQRDAEKSNKIPIVAHKKNGTNWLITMDAGWFLLQFAALRETYND